MLRAISLFLLALLLADQPFSYWLETGPVHSQADCDAETLGKVRLPAVKGGIPLDDLSTGQHYFCADGYPIAIYKWKDSWNWNYVPGEVFKERWR